MRLLSFFFRKDVVSVIALERAEDALRIRTEECEYWKAEVARLNECIAVIRSEVLLAEGRPPMEAKE